MAKIKRPLVWDGDKHHHRELVEDHELISGRHVHIHAHADNLITHGHDGGLLVMHPEHDATDIADFISKDQPNLIKQGSDGKLHARPPQAADFISEAEGNNLVVSGTDQKLYVADPIPGNLISENANNAITTGTDHKLFAPIVDASSLISNNGGNDLHLGTDGDLYINVIEQLKIDPTDKVMTKSALGIKGHVKLNFSASSRVLQLEGKSGHILSSITLPEGGMSLKHATTVDDPVGQAPGHYLLMVFETPTGDEEVYIDLSHLIDIYVPVDTSVDITNYTIKVNLDPSSPLRLSPDGIQIDYTDMLSTDLNNGLGVGSDGKLVVNQSPLADNISGNAGNILILGSDGKYYVPTTLVPAPSNSLPEELGAASIGASNDYARADHVHPMPVLSSSVNPATTIPLRDSYNFTNPNNSGAVGTSLNYARADHRHPLQVSPAAPEDIGVYSNVGTSTAYARSDHVHRYHRPTRDEAVVFHVNSATGSDDNDGKTAATAFATLTYALGRFVECDAGLPHLPDSYSAGTNYAEICLHGTVNFPADMVIDASATGLTGRLALVGDGRDSTFLRCAVANGQRLVITGAIQVDIMGLSLDCAIFATNGAIVTLGQRILPVTGSGEVLTSNPAIAFVPEIGSSSVELVTAARGAQIVFAGTDWYLSRRLDNYYISYINAMPGGSIYLSGTLHVEASAAACSATAFLYCDGGDIYLSSTVATDSPGNTNLATYVCYIDGISSHIHFPSNLSYPDRDPNLSILPQWTPSTSTPGLPGVKIAGTGIGGGSLTGVKFSYNSTVPTSCTQYPRWDGTSMAFTIGYGSLPAMAAGTTTQLTIHGGGAVLFWGGVFVVPEATSPVFVASSLDLSYTGGGSSGTDKTYVRLNIYAITAVPQNTKVKVFFVGV